MYCPIVEERLVAPYGYFYPLEALQLVHMVSN